MAIKPETQAQILAFVLYSIPLVVALWKCFNLLDGIEDRLEATIRDVERKLVSLGHQSELKSQQLESLNDKLVLAVNGIKEVASHVRARSKADADRLHARADQIERMLYLRSDAERLQARLDQIERYLSKTTDFESRE